MAKYQVLLERPIYEHAWVEIEADNVDDAYAEALLKPSWEMNWDLSPDAVGDASAVDYNLLKE